MQLFNQQYPSSNNLVLQKMQEVYNKLRRAMKPTQSLDPLGYLPTEIAVMVCRHLSVRDRV